MTDEAVTTERQLVVFDLAGEHYGVDIGTVREIIQMQTVTRVPGSASFVEGLINLRGVVVPVVDLRKRFGQESAEHDKDTRIMVIHCDGQDIGMIVDSVTEVLRITSDLVEPPSSLIVNVDSKYLLGIAKLTDRLVILLDTDRVLSRDEQGALMSIAAHEEPRTDAVKGQRKSPAAQKPQGAEAEKTPEKEGEKAEAAAGAI
jgi:purine-binding chemotaxis protein CheW